MNLVTFTSESMMNDLWLEAAVLHNAVKAQHLHYCVPDPRR